MKDMQSINMSRKLTFIERKQIAVALDRKIAQKRLSQKQAGEEIQRLITPPPHSSGQEGEGRKIKHRQKVDQGFIAKVRQGKVRTLGNGMKAICKYVDIFDISDEKMQTRVPSSKILKALSYFWDGTERQEAMLCRVLRALGDAERNDEKDNRV